ncbi:SH3 domain-containing protein [Alkaliphilus peptidifermentans]|uniref:Uncharacterized protein n=1 Tax=Alkaliphilus peptidifermentans DSM 18978 TaxID=1120976 RepID=A0A1G5BT25_9FIRM|nr:SH3 domain-containing protein [Alkaliphilus peptidifermentans]SCX93204.1 hypothetical protein SAMN03080606_00511 [Alkaliphilus peptidifermentans DSM 18978]
MKKYRVIKNRKTSSEKPIILFKDERVICGEESSEDSGWTGWIYCKSQNNEGWVSKQIINRNDNIGIVLEDYDAREFDIEIDEIIIMDKILNGWIWGAKKDNLGTKGWVPLNHVEEFTEINKPCHLNW